MQIRVQAIIKCKIIMLQTFKLYLVTLDVQYCITFFLPDSHFDDPANLGCAILRRNYRTNYWLRRLASNIYLCTLSLCSCLFLSTVLLTWMDSTLEVPLYNSSELGCRLLTFCAHMSDFNCVWMISWISCDRAVVLFRPG